MIAQPKSPLIASVTPKLDAASGLIHASNVIFPDCRPAPHWLSYTDVTVAAWCPSKTNATSRSPRSTRRSRAPVSFAGGGVGAGADVGSTRVGAVFSNEGAAGEGADSRLVQKSTKSSACSSIQSNADSIAAPAPATAAPPCNFRRLLELALSNSCALSPGSARRLCDSTRFLMAS